jgi:hypothetical protein
VLWSTEDTAYRGIGIPPIETERNWIVPAHAAVVLKGTAAERKVRSTPLLKGARNA